MGELQEVLEAMFALINKMEMAIKINISIIFAIRDYFVLHVGNVKPHG